MSLKKGTCLLSRFLVFACQVLKQGVVDDCSMCNLGLARPMQTKEFCDALEDATTSRGVRMILGWSLGGTFAKAGPTAFCPI